MAKELARTKPYRKLVDRVDRLEDTMNFLCAVARRLVEQMEELEHASAGSQLVHGDRAGPPHSLTRPGPTNKRM